MADPTQQVARISARRGKRLPLPFVPQSDNGGELGSIGAVVRTKGRHKSLRRQKVQAVQTRPSCQRGHRADFADKCVPDG